MNGGTNTLVTVPEPDEFVEQSMLPKTFNPLTGMISFRTGPIEGRPDYALKKDGSVIRTGPRILNKKERRRDRAAQAQWPAGAGFRFICACKALTFHYPSKTIVTAKGYSKPQTMETYKCSACGEHFDRAKIDAAVAAHAERTKREALNPNPTEPTTNEPTRD